MDVLEIALTVYDRILARRQAFAPGRATGGPPGPSGGNPAAAPAGERDPGPAPPASLPTAGYGRHRVAPAPGYETNERDEEAQPRPGGAAPVPSSDSFVSYPEAAAIEVTGADGVARVAAAVRSDGGPVGIRVELDRSGGVLPVARRLELRTPRTVAVVDAAQLEEPAAADLFAALAAVEVVGHDLRPQLRALAPLGFTPGRAFDTMLASQVLHAGEPVAGGLFGLGLGSVAARELSAAPAPPVEDPGAAGGDNGPRPAGLAAAPGGGDGVVEVLRLASALREKLAAAGRTGTAALEMRALPGLAWAAGVTLDRGRWDELAARAAAGRDRAAGRLAELAAGPADWFIPDAVKAAFARAGVGLGSARTAHLDRVKHRLAEALREFRYAHLRAVWLDPRRLERYLAADGRLYPEWRQIGGPNGGIRCTRPAAAGPDGGAGWPDCVTAPPGRALVRAEIGRAELLAAGVLAGDQTWEFALEAGIDPDAAVAAKLTGRHRDRVKPADLGLARAVIEVVLYGGGGAALAAYALRVHGIVLTASQATRNRQSFLGTFGRVASWHRAVGGGEAGEARTPGGRRVAGRDLEGRLRAQVRGTIADWLKAAIAQLWERRAECPTAVPVLFDRAAVVVECDASAAGAAAAWLRSCMSGEVPAAAVRVTSGDRDFGV